MVVGLLLLLLLLLLVIGVLHGVVVVGRRRAVRVLLARRFEGLAVLVRVPLVQDGLVPGTPAGL